MAKSAAERQREYRERKLRSLDGEQHERLQVVVSIHAKRALERLARYYSVTQREALERAVADAQSRVLDGLDASGQAAFYAGTLTASALQPNEESSVTVSQVGMDLEAVEVPVVEPMAGDPGKDRTGVDPEIVAKARAVEMVRANPKAGPKEIMAMLRAAGVEIPKTMRSNLKRWYIPRWEKEPEIAAMIGKTDTVNSTKAV